MPTRHILLLSLALALLAPVASGVEPLIHVDIWEHPIRLVAGELQTWKEKDRLRMFLATDGFRWTQGVLQVDADRAAIWFDEKLAKETGEAALDIYAEGNITIMQDGKVERYEQILVHANSSGPGAGIVIQQTLKRLKNRPVDEMLMRGEALRARTYTDFATKTPVKLAPKARLPKLEKAEVSHYDSLDAKMTEDGRNVFILKGNVVIQREGRTLKADNVVLWVRIPKKAKGKAAGKKAAKYKLEEFYAEGNVTLIQKKDTITAERVYENLTAEGEAGNRGLYVDARFALRSSEPGVFFHAAEVWHTGEGQYEARDAVFTTCEFGKPHWDMRGKLVRLIRTPEGAVVIAQHNFVRVAETPLLYWPSITHDIYDHHFIIKSFSAGTSSDLGAYVRTELDMEDMGFPRTDWSDLSLLVDHFSKRGPGVGVKFDYERESSFGHALAYYINDTADEDQPGSPVPSTGRGRFLWRHRTNLPNYWRAEAEVSYLSDRNFLREYFEDESKTGKEQETVLYFRKLDRNKGFTYLQKHRINDFDTTVERLPQLQYDVIGEPLLGDSVIYTSMSQLALLRRRVNDALHVSDPATTLRLHTEHEFALPFKLWILRFNPYYKLQFTAANEGRKGPLPVTGRTGQTAKTSAARLAKERADEQALIGQRDSAPVYRVANTFGLNASTDFWRIYNVQNDALNINRLRHIMTPEVKWEFTPLVTEGADSFNQFDQIDRIDEYNHFMMGLRNRFETKRGLPGAEQSRQFINFDVEANFFPGSDGRNRGVDDYLEVDFSYAIQDWITYVSEGNEFNISSGTWEIVANGIEFEPSERLYFYIGHEYIRNASSAVTLDWNYVVNPRWGVGLYEQYDFDNQTDDSQGKANSGSANIETSLVLRRYLHNWVLDIKFGLDEGRDDTRVSFSLTHRGSEKRLRRY